MSVRYAQLADRGWLEREYVERGRSTREIATELGTANTTVALALRRHGIPRRAGLVPLQAPQLQDRAWLQREYVERQRTTYDIATEMGADPQTVADALQRHGIPRRPSGPIPAAGAERFERHIDRQGPVPAAAPELGPCALWRGARSTDGTRGHFTVDGRDVGAAVFAFEQAYGPVPPGWHVHHICEVPLCVNPNHLAALSPEDHAALHTIPERAEIG